MATQTRTVPAIVAFAQTQINQYCAAQNLDADDEIPTPTIEVPSVLTSTLSDSANGSDFYMEFVNVYAKKKWTKHT